MALLTVVDSEGQLVDGPPTTLDAATVETVTADGVELVVDPTAGWAMVYLKARTALVDRANRVAFYHAIATGDDPMGSLLSGLEGLQTDDEWEVLSGDVHADVAREWRQLEGSDLSWDRLARRAFRGAVADGVQLTFAMADHADAVRATKHFLGRVETSYAICSYGRTAALEGVGVVMVPDRSPNFTAHDDETAEAIGRRRARLRAELPERLGARFEAAITTFIEDAEAPPVRLYATLERLRQALHDGTAVPEASMGDIATARTAIEDDPYLTDAERRTLIRRGIAHVVGVQETVAERVETAHRRRLLERIDRAIAEAPTELEERFARLTRLREELLAGEAEGGPLGDVLAAIAASPAVDPPSVRRICAAGVRKVDVERRRVVDGLREQVLTERVGGLPGLPEAFGARYDAPGRLTRGDIERAIVDAFPRLHRVESTRRPESPSVTREDVLFLGSLVVLTGFAAVGVVAIVRGMGLLGGLLS